MKLLFFSILKAVGKKTSLLVLVSSLFFSEEVARNVSAKHCPEKIRKIHMKTNVLKLLSRLQFCNFIKKKLRYRLFFVYFLIIFMFSRTSFLQNTSGRLLLYFVHEIHECSSLWASAFTFVNTDISIRRWGSQISLKFRRTPIISSSKLSCNGKVAYIDLDFASQKSVK